MKNLHQWLNIDSVHDKCITGIKTTGKNLIVSICDECNDSNAFEVVFINSKYIKLNDFMFGNIILSIEVYDSKDIDKIEDELRDLLGVSKTDVYYQASFQQVRDQIKNGKLLLIAIDPSYGLNGLILCEDIKLGEV